MAGIDALKNAIGSTIKIAKTADLALEDGKVSIMEGVKLAMAGFSFWNAVKNVAQLKAEYLDLDEAEKAELIAYFAQEFDLKNDDTELLIEQVFAGLLQLGNLITLVGK